MKERDNEVVMLAKNGNHDAFQQLMRQEQEKLYKVAYSYVYNEDDAVEIVQETFFKAYSSIGSLKEPAYFSTWITRILINTAISFLKNKKKSFVFSDWTGKILIPLYGVEEKMDLSMAIKSLSIKDRTVINLRFYMDYTNREIAEILNIPEGTVKARVHRALLKLKRKLCCKEGDYEQIFKQGDKRYL
ncbi:sigma-70 family RNA polymerase sigma factor [Bacillus salitolerans]|uniref:Sigma-70 family RNA polymerase sigma factor n=1 Tax=Bacillus salitolerans TaxID=1437434 RepID=A0ABW4LT30_9BACI